MPAPLAEVNIALHSGAVTGRLAARIFTSPRSFRNIPSKALHELFNHFSVAAEVALSDLLLHPQVAKSSNLSPPFTRRRRCGKPGKQRNRGIRTEDLDAAVCFQTSMSAAVRLAALI